jgi:hypothetical protein
MNGHGPHLPIDFFPMPDLHDFNKTSDVINAVNDSIITLPDAVSLSVARKLFTAGGPGGLR